jgi:hypothetical protein
MSAMLRCGLAMVMLCACGSRDLPCTPKRIGGTFCTPDAGRAANIDVTLELRDDCASACDKGTLSCAVTVDGGSIVLELAGQSCPPQQACPEVCGLKTYSCALPALADGTYTVSSPSNRSVTLQVGVGGVPSCRL